MLTESMLRLIASFYKKISSIILESKILYEFFYSMYRIRFLMFEEFFYKNQTYFIIFILVNIFFYDALFFIRAPMLFIIAFGNFFTLLIATYDFLNKDLPLLNEKFLGNREQALKTYATNLSTINNFLNLNNQRRSFHSTNVVLTGFENSKTTEKVLETGVEVVKKNPKTAAAVFIVGAGLFTYEHFRRSSDASRVADATANASNAIANASNAKAEFFNAAANSVKVNTNTLVQNNEFIRACIKDPSCPIERFKILAKSNQQLLRQNKNIEKSFASDNKNNGNLNSPLENGDNLDLTTFSKKFLFKFLENFKDFF